MNLLFLDTETTGKGTEDRLVQVAFKAPGDDCLVCNFKPPVPITFEAMATHHITEKMLADTQPFSDSHLKPLLQELLNENIMVAHNAIFDKEMLEREGLIVPRYIDTLKLAQFLFDEPSYKLQVLRYKYNLEVDGVAHSADGDVAVLEKLFNHLCNKFAEKHTGNYIEALIEMQAISQAPTLLRRISFGKHRGTEFKALPRDYLKWLSGQSDLDEDLKFTLKHYLTLP